VGSGELEEILKSELSTISLKAKFLGWRSDIENILGEWMEISGYKLNCIYEAYIGMEGIIWYLVTRGPNWSEELEQSYAGLRECERQISQYTTSQQTLERKLGKDMSRMVNIRWMEVGRLWIKNWTNEEQHLSLAHEWHHNSMWKLHHLITTYSLAEQINYNDMEGKNTNLQATFQYHLEESEACGVRASELERELGITY
jgi:hypothetical protein